MLRFLHLTDIQQIQIPRQLRESGKDESRLKNRGPCEFRSHDPRIKSPLLYRLSYRPHCMLNYWVLTLFFRCRGKRIGDLEPWRHAPNQSRDGFSRAMGCAKTAPRPVASRHRIHLLIRNPKNLDTYKPQQQLPRTHLQMPTMKSLPLDVLILRALSDETNDPFRQSAETIHVTNVRTPRHIYQARALLIASPESPKIST